MKPERRSSRRALALRRAALERRAAVLGVARKRGPRRLEPGADPRAPILRLASLLSESGPLFVRFGRYLASRPDLLQAAEAAALRAALPETAPPIDAGVIAARIAAAGGVPIESVLPGLDPAPVASGLVCQRHRARLTGGRRVLVDVVRPEVLETLGDDLELLAPLARWLAESELALALETADLDDFRAGAAAGLDLGLRAAAFDALRPRAAARGLVVPAVVESLSGPGVLVFEALPGASLSAWFPQLNLATGTTVPEPPDDPRATEVAGRLAALWLAAALGGEPYPVEIDAAEVLVLNDGRLAWTGGTFATLPDAAREPLRRYLAAAAGQDPELALSILLEDLTTAGSTRADAERLRRRFRQAVPLRDGGLGAIDDLGGYLFLYWRLVRDAGFRLRPQLVSFERGLAEVVTAVRGLTAGGDPLRDGLDRAQLRSGLGEIGELVALRQLGRSAQEALGLLAALPARVDRLLDLTAQGGFTVRLEMQEPSPPAHRRWPGTVLGVLLAMIAVAVLADHPSATAALGVWGERLAAVLLVALGVQLMRPPRPPGRSR